MLKKIWVFLTPILMFLLKGIICIPLTFLLAWCCDELFEMEFLDKIQVLYITIWILIPWLKSYLKHV